MSINLLDILTEALQSSSLAHDFLKELTAEDKNQLLNDIENYGGSFFHWLCRGGLPLLISQSDFFIPYLIKSQLKPTMTKGPYQGASLFYCLCTIPKGCQLMETKWHNFSPLLTSEILGQAVTGEGPDRGMSPFFWLCTNPEGRQLIKAQWHTFSPLLTSRILGQTATEGPYKGTSSFYVLCATPEGRQVMEAQWHTFSPLLTAEILGQTVTGEGPYKGTSPFFWLCVTPEGRRLIETQWDTFLPLLTSEILAQTATEGPYKGTSPFYWLCATPEGRQLLEAKWHTFSPLLTSEILGQAVTCEGPDKGKSPFYWLCRTPEGRQLIKIKWHTFLPLLTSEILDQAVTGEGSDKGMTPFYWLFATFEKHNLLEVHWDNFKPFVTQEMLLQRDSSELSPLFYLCGGIKKTLFLHKNWEVFSPFLTQEFLSYVPSQGPSKNKPPFYYLCTTNSGHHLLYEQWDFFVERLNDPVMQHLLPQGTSILYELMVDRKDSDGKNWELLHKQWEYFARFINKKFLMQTSTILGVNALYFLCTPKGLELLMQKWSFFKPLLSDPQLWNQEGIANNAYKENTPLLRLLDSEKGRLFILQNKAFFEPLINLHTLCASPYGCRLLNNESDFFKELFPIKSLWVQRIIAEGDDEGKMPLYELCKNPDGLEFLYNNWDFFEPIFNKNLLLQPVANEGSDKGKNILYCLLSHPIGCILIHHHWSFFKTCFDQELLSQRMPAPYEQTYLNLLCKKDTASFQLLLKRWNFFKNMLTKELLKQQLSSLGTTAFYELVSSEQGIQLIRQNGPLFEKLIDTELLSTTINLGENQFTTPFYQLCASQEGIKLLIKQQDFFKPLLNTALFTQSSSTKSPIVALCNPLGLQFIAKNWEIIKPALHADLLSAPCLGGITVFEAISNASETFALIKNDVDFFKPMITKELFNATSTPSPNILFLCAVFLSKSEAYAYFQTLSPTARSLTLKETASKPDFLRQLLSFYPLNNEEPLAPELYSAFENTESLNLLLSFYDTEEARHAALRKIISTPELAKQAFTYAMKNTNSLEVLLDLYSNDEKRLEQIKNLGEGAVFSLAVQSRTLLNKLLALYSSKADCVTAIEQGKSDLNSNTPLHRAANNPESLVILLELYPKERRIEAITTLNDDKESVLDCAAENPQSLSLLLALYPEGQAPIEKMGGAIFRHALKNLSSLNHLLSLFSEDKIFNIVTELNDNSMSVLHYAVKLPDSMRAIFNALSPKNRFKALGIKNGQKETLLQCLLKYPDLLASLFPALQEVSKKQLLSLEDTRYYESTEEVPVGLLALDTLLTLEYKAAQLDVTPRQNLYAGDATLVQKSETRFQAVLETYKSQYESLTLEEIEKDLKRDVLGFILEQAQAEKEPPQAILDLLTPENIERLSSGTDATLAKRARTLFTSNTDTYQMVWRAYDQQSKTRGWDNLFVSPAVDKSVHSGMEGDISLSSASDKVRKRAAFYYLAARDESSEELKASKKTRLQNFFACIGECRRAHNTEEAGDRNNTQIDDPSCYPGTITRLSDSVLMHPHFKENTLDTIEEFIYLKIKAQTETLLDSLLREELSCEEKNKYYYALLMLGLDNLSEILFQNPEQLTLPDLEGNNLTMKELTPYRAYFLKHLDMEEIVNQMIIHAHKQGMITQNSHIKWIEYCVIKALLNIKGLNINLNLKQQEILLNEKTEMDIDKEKEEDEESSYFPKPPVPILASRKQSFFQPAEEEQLFKDYYKPLIVYKLAKNLKHYAPEWSPQSKLTFIHNDVIKPNVKTIIALQDCLERSAKDIFEEISLLGGTPPSIEKEALNHALKATLKTFMKVVSIKRQRVEDLENVGPNPKRTNRGNNFT